jgi:hypothetical protein
MTQDSSQSPSAADAATYRSKPLPKGIRILGPDEQSGPTMGVVSEGEEGLPWGYLHLRYYVAESFDRKIESLHFEDGDFRPRCFIHRTVHVRKKSNGQGIVKEEKPTVSGLVFLQGTTKQLKAFLVKYFPNYYLVNNCTTGLPAVIPNSVMQPFMQLMSTEPDRITFLRDPFIKFAKDHVKLRILTGVMAGQEGYVVRILRDRNLVMDFGGYAVAISNVHNEIFEIAE